MTGQILVAANGGHHLIKMVGDVRLTLAISFDRFIKSMFSDKFQSVTFDLREAYAVDSTTLGLMAKIALKAREFRFKPTVWIKSQSIQRMMDVMGFSEILDIYLDADGCGGLDFESSVELEALQDHEDEIRERVLEAHKILIAMSENNELKFRELVESLEQGH